MNSAGTELEAAYRASLRADTRRAHAILAEDDRAGGLVAAWRLALRGALALIDGTHEPPRRSEIASLLAGDQLATVALEACTHAETHAFVRLDRQALLGLYELRRSALVPEHEGAELGRGRAQLMLELLSGNIEGTTANAPRFVELADRYGAQGAMVELLALQALGAFGARELAFAVELARRAARLARESDLRISRYLASLVLARVRRLSGRPHLAARILSTLMPFLPSGWRGWLHWELELSGEPLRDEPLSNAPSSACVVALRALFAACGASPDVFAERVNDLRSAADGCQFLRTESECLLGLLDWRTDAETVPPACASFVRGEAAEVPLGLHGLVADPGSSSAAPVAHVAWFPERAPRRVLGIVAPAFSSASNAAVLDLSRLHAGRADTALAALALAGSQGLDESSLFRECYGFRYSARVHEAALGMLIHRARTRLPEGISVDREKGRLTLTGERQLLVPDPRCAEQVEGRLLRLVAREGTSTTRAAARTLGVSLRTVQAAMSRLVERGECTLDRSGRRIVYRVDDTSYAIPSKPQAGA